MKKSSFNYRSGIWVLIVAAVVLEGISCFMYFSSKWAIRKEAVERARVELEKAEQEIQMHTIEMETAAKTLALLAEKYIDYPDSMYGATRLAVQTIKTYTSLAVAFVPDYYPQKGRYFEVCSSRITEDSVYTRQIGSAEHDYTAMEWYQNGFLKDSCWWCEPYLDDSGSQTFVVSCSCPVRDRQGRVVAVVCVDMSLDYLQQLSENLKIYNSYSSIRSSTGQNIVSAPDTVPGRKYNIFNEEIDATGWHIEIIISEDELFRDLNRIGFWVGLMMILGLLILAFILWHSATAIRKMVEFAEKNQRMEGELEVAQTIQSAMLPKVFPPFSDRLDLNVYGVVHPAKEVGGDLYDFYVRSEKLFFCVGDVSGKGVPAALVMATTRSLFRSVTAHEEEPSAILRMMNDALSDTNEQNMFITLFLGVLDLHSGRLEYCNAGHNAPVLLRNGCAPEMMDVLPNLPVGVSAGFAYRAQETHIAYNDLLFLYTDGLTEAENPQKQLFGEGRMNEALTRFAHLRPRGMVDAMRAEVAAFAGEAQQSDDITMLAVRYQQPAIIMRNDIQQIPTLAEWVEWLQIPAELNMPVNLALEEAVTNVMLYAYPESKNGQVLVESWRSGASIYFTISDSGIPFDPTEQKEADISLSAEEREIGGLGIHLVRQLMDEISYCREDNKNILTLSKKIK